MELRKKLNKIILVEKLGRIFKDFTISNKEKEIDWFEIVKILDENGLEIKEK